MTKHSSAEVREVANKMLNEGMTQSATAEIVGVSRRTINRWSARAKAGCDQQCLPRGHRPRAISDEKCKEIIEYIKNNSTAFIHEIIENLGLNCSETTLRDTLKRLGYSHKKTSVRASQRDREDVKKKTRMAK